MKTLLFVPIETKVREQDGKLLFSLAAAEAGYDVILGWQTALTEQIHRFDRGIYVDKSVAGSKPAWFRACRAFGNRIVAWDEEGLVFFDAEVYREMRVDPRAMELVERVFAWGDVHAAALRAAAPAHEDRMIVTGNPRFDVLRPEFREFLAPRSRELRSRFGPYLLLNTGFPFGNHFRTEETVRAMLAQYRINQSRPGFFDGWVQDHKQGFEFFRSLLPRLRQAFPEHTLVVRPHPTENHDVWRELAAQHTKCTVHAEGSVDPWILGADCVVHYNCTTGIEAFLLDVPAVACRLGGEDRYSQPLPVALSLEAFSVDEAVERVRDATSNRADFQPLRLDASRAETARRYMAGLTGPLASDRILEALRAVPSPVRRRALPDRLTQAARTGWRAVLRVQRSLTMDRPDGYVRQKFPGLDLAEIRASATALARCSGRFGGVRILPSLRDCCLITAESNVNVSKEENL